MGSLERAGIKMGRFKFYVYEVLDVAGDVIYVGKGCDRRMYKSQDERGGASCREVARFKNERDAYAYEVVRIAEYNGLLNRNKGGYGGCSGSHVCVPHPATWAQCKAALDGLALFFSVHEKGFRQFLGKQDLFSLAVQSLRNACSEFGRDRCIKQMAALGVDGARYV